MSDLTDRLLTDAWDGTCEMNKMKAEIERLEKENAELRNALKLYQFDLGRALKALEESK